MSERIDYRIQPRMKWYMVQQTALELVEASKHSGIQPEKMVFIGGFAAFLHLREVVGTKALPRWRGTEDIDIAIFERGGSAKLIKGIERRSVDKAFEIKYKHPHFPDKASCEINGKGKGFLDPKQRWVDLDLYSPSEVSHNKIHFNNRVLGGFPDNFITEPVIVRENASVPTIADCLILKLDIVNYTSKSDLRLKDKIDILSLLLSGESYGIRVDSLLKSVLSRVDRFWLGRTKQIFSGVLSMAKSFEGNPYVFLPSVQYLKSAKDYLSKSTSELDNIY